MSFDFLLETQGHVVKLLNNSFKKGRIVHTYLFEGARGTAKLDAAYYLAALLLCQSDEKPCLSCEECSKIINRNHPSVILVSPENNVIRKEQADNLGKEFSLKSIDEKSRVFIIDEIDKATSATANSLLKFLEEAGTDNYGVLITENLYNVLPTIRSRSQIVSFSQLRPQIIADKLISLGIEEETSYVLANITNNVEECLEMINEGKILDIIDLTKKMAYSLVKKEKSPLLIFYEDGKFLLSESDKRYHNIFLDLMIAFFSSLLYLTLNQNEKIIFKNIINKIASDVDIPPQRIIGELEKILDYKQKLRYNINIELFYTQMLTAVEL
ncbi:MAG: AAA family ATPase [Bacilli bacterium]|nr:AAA family ATPase [Bacilli bacterium]MDD4076419.1 AAA family ATPase [Bacilli bacterium]MDD4387781.1 AAA family ATPase [Bacilli bacterium]